VIACDQAEITQSVGVFFALDDVNGIAAAGVALKAGFIDGETALAMLDETGLLPLIEASS
jgi:hypothetical protein